MDLAFQVSGNVGPPAFDPRVDQAGAVAFGLNQKSRDGPQDDAQNRPQAAHPARRRGRDPAVGEKDGNVTAARFMQKPRPEFRFGQDEEIGIHPAEHAPHTPGEIKGDEKDEVRGGHLFLGHTPSGAGQRGDPDDPLGIPGLQPADEALERKDLADRNGMDPDERPPGGPGRKP